MLNFSGETLAFFKAKEEEQVAALRSGEKDEQSAIYREQQARFFELLRETREESRRLLVAGGILQKGLISG